MQINLSQLILQLVNFGILVFIMAKFLYRPVLKILEERAKKVQEGLVAAQENIEAREKLEAERRKELAKAEKQAAQLLDEARKEAETMKSSIVEEARAEAQKVVSKQESLLVQRMAEEEQRLKDNISTFVVATTKTVLGDALSEKDLKEITSKELANLEKSHAK